MNCFQIFSDCTLAFCLYKYAVLLTELLVTISMHTIFVTFNVYSLYLAVLEEKKQTKNNNTCYAIVKLALLVFCITIHQIIN